MVVKVGWQKEAAIDDDDTSAFPLTRVTTDACLACLESLAPPPLLASPLQHNQMKPAQRCYARAAPPPLPPAKQHAESPEPRDGTRNTAD